MGHILSPTFDHILTPLIIGVAAFLYWMRRRKAVSIQYAYFRVILYLVRGIGTFIFVVSVLMLLYAVADVFGHLGWNQSIWLMPMTLSIGAVGYAVRRAAGWGLRQQDQRGA